MRRLNRLCLLGVVLLPAAAQSQNPADSAARADSIAIVRELEAAQRGDTVARPTARQGALNPRLLPDISVVGDLIADFSPRGSTQEGGERFLIREVEVALQAVVDPYFRGDVFLGFSDEEGAAVEQAYLTATALPARLEARLGRFLMPMGKQITTHRHDLHTIEYPHVIQSFLGPEGLKGTGIYLSRVFAPLGFYQELIGNVVDAVAESPEDAVLDEPLNRRISQLGYLVRLRNYWDLSQATNLEVSFSGMTGRRARELGFETVDGFTAQAARQTTIGADVTYRWRPLQQGLYRSFIVQAEVMQQRDDGTRGIMGHDIEGNPITLVGLPAEKRVGAYVFARYQTSRRSFVGVRADVVENPADIGGNTRAVSGYLQLFPSEFSKLLGGLERFMPGGGEKALTRIIFQATFALGPHKPHPF